jgi:hypothetical protein
VSIPFGFFHLPTLKRYSERKQESFVCNKDIKSGYGVASVVDKCKSAPSKVQNGAPDKNQA